MNEGLVTDAIRATEEMLIRTVEGSLFESQTNYSNNTVISFRNASIVAVRY